MVKTNPLLLLEARPSSFNSRYSTTPLKKVMAPLLQFRAGRAVRQGDSNTVVCQPERGSVLVISPRSAALLPY